MVTKGKRIAEAKERNTCSLSTDVVLNKRRTRVKAMSAVECGVLRQSGGGVVVELL